MTAALDVPTARSASLAPSSRSRGSLVGATWDTDLDRTTLMCPADDSLIPFPGAGTAKESLREDISMNVAHTMHTLCRNENRQLRFSEVGACRELARRPSERT